MGFSRSDIRPAMDVYTLDNAYLGSVLSVSSGPSSPRHERVFDDARQSGANNGEQLGPMPTQQIGNPGPANQSARSLYATTGQADRASLGHGTLQVGRWFGLVGRRTIPLDAVQTVSLERVVLRLRSSDIRTA